MEKSVSLNASKEELVRWGPQDAPDDWLSLPSPDSPDQLYGLAWLTPRGRYHVIVAVDKDRTTATVIRANYLRFVEGDRVPRVPDKYVDQALWYIQKLHEKKDSE